MYHLSDINHVFDKSPFKSVTARTSPSIGTQWIRKKNYHNKYFKDVSIVSFFFLVCLFCFLSLLLLSFFFVFVFLLHNFKEQFMAIQCNSGNVLWPPPSLRIAVFVLGQCPSCSRLLNSKPSCYYTVRATYAWAQLFFNHYTHSGASPSRRAWERSPIPIEIGETKKHA